jgi:hypothetical protein
MKHLLIHVIALERALMPKVTDAGEYHRHFAFVGGGDHFFVTN